MPVFSYKAVNDKGRVVLGTMEASNLLDLELRLGKIDLDLVTGKISRLRAGVGHISRRDLINFCFHLEQSLRGGVPLIEALADLQETVQQGYFRQIISTIVVAIEGGKTFSAALEDHPQVFDHIFCGLVRAGEESGTLPEIMRSLVDSIKWQDELIVKTRRLFIYPAFASVFVLGASLFLLLYLVPNIATLLQSSGKALPPVTSAIITISSYLKKYGLILLGVLVAFIVAIPLLVRFNKRANHLWSYMLIKIPYIGPVVYKIILSRFSNVFAMLYSSGIGVLDAIRITREVVGNRVVSRALDDVRQDISDGRGISDAFARSGLFPSLVVRMFRIGETTGNLDSALRNVHYFYSRDVDESIARMQAMITPVMILILGGILISVLMTVFGPLYSFIGTIG